MTNKTVRIGGILVPMAIAKQWVRKYTSPANVSELNPYAYPAYDHYERENNDPRRLSDADLLAPGLLNVPVKIRSFYGLQRLRPVLESGLRNENLSLNLADIEDADIGTMVKPLYAVLDDPETRPWNVSTTTLSKVLHRKYPKSLVLHDKWVQACYLGSNAGQFPRVAGRSRSDYMVAITRAIAHDIRTQPEIFDELDQSASTPGDLAHVRLLDILAWKSRGSTSREA